MNKSNDSSDSILTAFAENYTSYHGWLAVIICILGLTFNSFNIIILRKISEANMVKINSILISIAVSDSILMTSYLPYSTYTYIIKTKLERDSEDDNLVWPIFSMIHMIVSVTSHCISIWLTVFLAFYRYLFMSNSVNKLHSGRKTNICSQANKYILENCKILILIICIFCILICSPVYAYPLFKYTSINFGKSNDFLFNAMFYSQAIMVKIIPCCLLVTFISMLVGQLIAVKNNHKKLTPSSNIVNFNYDKRFKLNSNFFILNKKRDSKVQSLKIAF